MDQTDVNKFSEALSPCQKAHMALEFIALTAATDANSCGNLIA